MNKSFKYDLCPQWETYDRIGYTWMPFIMFNQTPNFRSDVLNTDNRGFRFNSINLTQNNSIFDANNMKKSNYYHTWRVICLWCWSIF